MKKYSWLLTLAPLMVMACGSNTSSPTQSSLPDVAKSSLTYNANPSVTTATQQAVNNDLNDFGLKVLQNLAPSDQNFSTSPVSGFIALTLTAEGAQGITADEMKAVLYPDVAVSDIQAATNQLEQGVKANARPLTADQQVVVNLANDVFVQKGLTLEQPFLDNLMMNYNSGVELVDFQADSSAATTEIDNWVASETNNLIPKLIPPGALDSMTRLVLVNALYLNASWLTVFDAKKTAPQVFHGTSDASVDFMNASLALNYATGAGWAGVDIPYYGGSLVMTAILPDAGQFDTVKASLNAAWFSSFDTAAQQEQVGLALPKFNLTGSTVSWKQTLQALGMTTLFESSCNLNGITQQEQLYVDDVLQQVYVAVAEKGTEAAAATAVIIRDMSVDLPPPVTMTLNRPFLFFVREKGGPILFAGQIVSLKTS